MSNTQHADHSHYEHHPHHPHYTPHSHPEPPSQPEAHIAHAVSAEDLISSDPVPLPHLKYQIPLHPSLFTFFRHISSSLACSSMNSEDIRCLEAFCPTRHTDIRPDKMAEHLRVHHCWGPRALSALPRYAQQIKNHSLYFCLLKQCGFAHSFPRGDGAESWREVHADHPYIVIPRTRAHRELKDIAPDIILSALQGLKPFIGRIENWISTLHQLGQDNPWTPTYHELSKRWRDLKPHLTHFFRDLPLGSLEFYLQDPITEMFDIHEGLKTISAQYQTQTYFVCVCLKAFDSLASLVSHRKGRTPCDLPHGLSALPCHIQEQSDEQKSHLKYHNAANSIAWLIRTEMAYIERDLNIGDPHHQGLINHFRQYADKLSAELARNWHRPDFLYLLSRDLQRLRSGLVTWSDMDIPKIELSRAQESDQYLRFYPYVSLRQLLAFEANQPSDYTVLTRCIADANFDGYPCFICHNSSHQYVWYFLYEFMQHMHQHHQAAHSLMAIVTRVGSKALAAPRRNNSNTPKLSIFRNDLINQWQDVLQSRSHAVPTYGKTINEKDYLRVVQNRYDPKSRPASFVHSTAEMCRPLLDQLAQDLIWLEDLATKTDFRYRQYIGRCFVLLYVLILRAPVLNPSSSLDTGIQKEHSHCHIR